MASTKSIRTLLMAAPLLVAATGLSGCGGRDAELAEQVMEAKQAAARAEAAQMAAEQALTRISRQQAPIAEATVVEQEPDDGGDVRPDVDTETGFSDDPTPQG